MNFWDKKKNVTITLKEKTNLVLLVEAMRIGVDKSRLVEELVVGNPEFIRHIEKMKQEGWDF